MEGMDGDVRRWGRHSPGGFSAEKCPGRLQPWGTIKHAIEDLTSKSKPKSEPSGGTETEGRATGQILCESSSQSRAFLYRKNQPAFTALPRVYNDWWT